MLKVGKMQRLTVKKLVHFGAYLDAGTENERDNVLLPRSQVPPGTKPGDAFDVFLYLDSEDRIIATRQKPLAQVGELAYLQVVEKATVGTFLNWGLEKDLFLPFSEQHYRIDEGKSYLVGVYLDKQGRPCATLHVEKFLRNDSPYQLNDIVDAVVYSTKRGLGAFVAVDKRYAGFIPEQDAFFPIKVGARLKLRVAKVLDDGRLTLSTRQLAHRQMRDDAAMILELMRQHDGFLPLNDRSHPSAIERALHISKKAFKRAVGRLLKTRQIEQTDQGIRLTEGRISQETQPRSALQRRNVASRARRDQPRQKRRNVFPRTAKQISSHERHGKHSPKKRHPEH
ncbi:RNA-binding protein [candidate division KSB3 bacterium]|uniref:RNA-binding protein n=1 Tax=candidate division KSB3 bacterium TaxID=2044937 RepID=A0A2G6E269_9BACT|nr:MAG: RNA-binding protein [candidate division KSB3 bacterium]PIE28651.1 MAG: RNA-binding protein [candidate division KSB3 bacterium]